MLTSHSASYVSWRCSGCSRYVITVTATVPPSWHGLTSSIRPVLSSSFSCCSFRPLFMQAHTHTHTHTRFTWRIQLFNSVAPIMHAGPVLNKSSWTLDFAGNDSRVRDSQGTADNVYIEDGHLVLRSQRQKLNGYDFTSGAVRAPQLITTIFPPSIYDGLPQRPCCCN